MALDNMDNSVLIPHAQLERLLPGVVVATKSPEPNFDLVSRWLSSRTQSEPSSTTAAGHHLRQEFSLVEWQESILSELPSGASQQLALLTLGISCMLSPNRSCIDAHTQDCVWTLIRDAMRSDAGLTGPDYAPSRSAQGFLALPLCSLIQGGNIDILFRLHVWMPDNQRGKAEVAVHSHQAFAQSWTLYGKGTDVSYHVQPVEEYDQGTHALYAIGWNDGKSQSTTYATHQLSSTVVNTGKYMRARVTDSSVHSRYDTYSVPAATYHTTKVAPQALHATLFCFDASRGFEKDAGVLGPKDWTENTQFRDPAGITPRDLVDVVDRARNGIEQVIKQQPVSGTEEAGQASSLDRVDSSGEDESTT